MNRKFRRALKAVGIGKEVPLTDIRNEYYKACAEAGELQYKINQFQQSLAELNEKIAKLNEAYAEGLTQQKASQPSPVEAGEASAPASPSEAK